MATTFVRRLTPPSIFNLYYIKTDKGGYNRCIQIKPDGSVLPNCVGYAWGRFCEEQGIHDCRLSRGNAENWYPRSDGYERGQFPKLGAVICWSDSAGDGHVAIVEKVYPNGDILTSNSAYGGSRFYLKELTRSSNYYMGDTYHFQGFIYPTVDFIDPDTPVPPEPTNTYKTRFPWVLYSRKFRKRHLTQ